MRRMNIANNNAFIVVFSVDDQQSFQQALDIADNINRTKHERCLKYRRRTLFVGILNKMLHVTAHPPIPHWMAKWLFRKWFFGKSDKTHFKTTYNT
ncbi:hypothetical protein NP493_422g00012 [Ridgeia piscesae]|uniref:Uncharacterized protein n=1 Tax=Ridgeia piscesae TaxID=27915 RepID=A0AAD9NU83_RIDPI|nr:hypothetical protein NP493_422g00012 [Ridgeia piscesae]